MTCDHHQQQVNAWLDNQLNASERQRIGEHLETCDTCRRLYAQRKDDDERLHAAFGSARESAAWLADRVIAQLPESELPESSAAFARSWSPKWSLLMAVAAGFLLALVIFPPWNQPTLVKSTAAPIARVSLVAGSVEMASGDLAGNNLVWQTRSMACPVSERSRVRTGAEDLCEIRGSDGDIIRMNSETELSVTKAKHVELNRGQIWCKTSIADDALHITTPDSEFRVAGTCDVMKSNEHTDVLVIEGTATLQGKQGPATLQAGDRARLSNGELNDSTAFVDPLLATRWIHQLLARRAVDDPEASERSEQLWSAVGQAKLSLLYEEELRVLGDQCSKPLLTYLKSPESRREPKKRVRAAKILADVAGHRWAPDLVGLLEDGNEDVRYHASRGLERLTGQTFGVASSDWRNPQTCTNALKAWQEWKQHNRQRFPNSPLISPTKDVRKKKS